MRLYSREKKREASFLNLRLKEFKVKQYLTAYLFITPALDFIGFVYLYQFIQLFRSSFYQLDMAGNSKWVGLSNFKYLYIDGQFWIALRNNTVLLLVVPVMTIISIIIAVILYEKIKGWKFYRVVIFLPYITSITALGVVFSHVLRKDGMLNSILESVNLDFLALDWVGDPKIALYTVAVIIIWKQVGFGIILFLARLMSANEDIFEAAKIDGANWFQNIRYMVIPQLSTVIQFYTVITGIYVISWIFDYIFIIT